MTHGKANNHSHRIPQQFGALLQQRPVVEGSAYDNFATAGKKIQPPGAKPQPLVNLQKTRSTSLTVSKQPLREDTSPHCARLLQAQSTVLRGGVGACPNRARCRHCGQGEREEQLFFESRRARRRLDLVSRAWRSGRTSPQPSFHSASAAASALPTSTSAATASLPMKRLWSCWMSYGRASGLELPSFHRAKTISVIGSARGTSAMLHPGVADGLTASLAGRDRGDSRRDGNQFSSGDGLGIQQPGSITWGTKAKVQTPSGRADDSAICPAVARNDRRVG